MCEIIKLARDTYFPDKGGNFCNLIFGLYNSTSMKVSVSVYSGLWFYYYKTQKHWQELMRYMKLDSPFGFGAIKFVHEARVQRVSWKRPARAPRRASASRESKLEIGLFSCSCCGTCLHGTCYMLLGIFFILRWVENNRDRKSVV